MLPLVALPSKFGMFLSMLHQYSKTFHSCIDISNMDKPMLCIGYATSHILFCKVGWQSSASSYMPSHISHNNYIIHIWLNWFSQDTVTWGLQSFVYCIMGLKNGGLEIGLGRFFFSICFLTSLTFLLLL